MKVNFTYKINQYSKDFIKEKIKLPEFDFVCGQFVKKRFTDNWYDVLLPEDMSIKAKETKVFDLGILVDFPSELAGKIKLRSSAGKQGLILPNAIGEIEHTYNGINDTWKGIIYNSTDEDFHFRKGDRVFQITWAIRDDASIISKLKWLFTTAFDIELVNKNYFRKNDDRGGLGSSGQ